MKIIAFLLLAVPAIGSPYFHFAEAGHLKQFAGASIDPLSPGQTSVISEVAVITHSPKDGCAFPSIACVDWSPLAIGPSYNAGRFAVVFGPVANMAPVVKASLRAVLDLLPGYEWVSGADEALSLPDSGTTIAFGPQLWVNPFRDGIIQPFNKWMPAGRIFAGAAVKF